MLKEVQGPYAFENLVWAGGIKVEAFKLYRTRQGVTTMRATAGRTHPGCVYGSEGGRALL